MKEYYDYLNGVIDGKIIAPQTIKQAAERIKGFMNRPDIYFDEENVQMCFDFIACMKEIEIEEQKSAALLPFQKFVVGTLIGLKYKDTNARMCNECLLLMGRKNAKTSLIAKLCAYYLLVDGSPSPFIGCVATSAQNARILFEKAQKYLKTIDPGERVLKHYRNYVKCPKTDGEFHVFSSESSTLEGYGFLLACADEVHTYKDNKLLSVLRASMGARKNHCLFQISTAGTLLDGYPLFDTCKMSKRILSGDIEDDSFFPFIYQMDEGDDVEDERNWIKCNPSIDVIVSRKYLRDQLTLAKNEPSQRALIYTKNFNIWQNTISAWIPEEKVSSCMKKLNIEDFYGKFAYIGVDLSQVSDLAAVSLVVPDGDKYYFFNWGFLPRDTFIESPNHALYQRFLDDGDLIVTDGNIADYDYITNKICELCQNFMIQGILYDRWNSSQWALQCTELGLPLVPFAQGLQNFNGPTKRLEELILAGNAVIDKSIMMLWEFSCAEIKMDHAQNIKVIKTARNNKIDNIIASIEALGGFLTNPVGNDLEIFVL